MINLRYHIVSLVAVFLAIGIGIVMGTTVIDKVTVEALNGRLDRVERSVTRVREENRRLTEQVRIGTDFADQARDFVLRDHLRNAPVLVLAVTGVNRNGVDALTAALAESAANLQGTVWFTPRMRIDNEPDRRALAALVPPEAAREAGAPPATSGAAGSLSVTADDIRRSAIRSVLEPGRLAVLVTAGFAVYEPPAVADPSGTPPRPAADLRALPVEGTRFAIVSGAGSEVGDDLLAQPLVEALAEGASRVVAVEAGQDSPGGRGVFVGTLRSDPDLGPRVSTVDNVESPMGQAAAVLALEQLSLPRLGHFGVGPGAQRLLPQPVTGSAP